MVSMRTIFADHVADARAAVALLEVVGDRASSGCAPCPRRAPRPPRRNSGRRRAGCGRAGDFAEQLIGMQRRDIGGVARLRRRPTRALARQPCRREHPAMPLGHLLQGHRQPSATSACAGGWPPSSRRARRAACACGSTTPRRWPGWRPAAATASRSSLGRPGGAEPRRRPRRTCSIEAFGCDPARRSSRASPSTRAMRAPAAAWINLEYLSRRALRRAPARPALARVRGPRRRA